MHMNKFSSGFSLIYFIFKKIEDRILKMDRFFREIPDDHYEDFRKFYPVLSLF